MVNLNYFCFFISLIILLYSAVSNGSIDIEKTPVQYERVKQCLVGLNVNAAILDDPDIFEASSEHDGGCYFACHAQAFDLITANGSLNRTTFEAYDKKETIKSTIHFEKLEKLADHCKKEAKGDVCDMSNCIILKSGILENAVEEIVAGILGSNSSTASND